MPSAFNSLKTAFNEIISFQHVSAVLWLERECRSDGFGEPSHVKEWKTVKPNAATKNDSLAKDSITSTLVH